MADYRFEADDIRDLTEFLEESFDGTKADPHRFAQDLLAAAEQDPEFRLVLRQWINRSTSYAEISVHGYHLSRMAEVYADRRLGVLIALRLLWLEKTVPALQDICAFMGTACYADRDVLDGGLCYAARHFEEGWVLLGCRGARTDPSQLCLCDLWLVMEHNPMLIYPVIGMPVGVRLQITKDLDRYVVYYENEEEVNE